MNEASRQPVLPTHVLRVDKIQLGDILLSKGRGKFSHEIDMSTGARGYSHAALIVNYCQTYESDGHLIGTRPLYPLAQNLMEGAVVFSLAPDNPIHFDVFRHPQMPFMDGFLNSKTPEFADAYEKLMDDTYGADYSEMRRLVKLAETSRFKKWIFELYARFDDAQNREKKIYSCFCSELVAQFFSSMGLPLFRDNRKPEQVTPNSLSDGAVCLLEKVDEAKNEWPAPGDFQLVDRNKDTIWKHFPPDVEDSHAVFAHQQRLFIRDLDLMYAEIIRRFGKP